MPRYEEQIQILTDCVERDRENEKEIVGRWGIRRMFVPFVSLVGFDFAPVAGPDTKLPIPPSSLVTELGLPCSLTACQP